MREIKFRAWFPSQYYNEPHMSYFDREENKRSRVWDLDEITRSGNVDAPIYMQYTGLKDKNGKEIYEGDVVKWTAKDIDLCNMYDRHGYGKKLVVLNLESGFTLAVSTKCTVPNNGGNIDNYTFWNYHNRLEVIGNIYENPELLEKTQWQ